MKERGEVVDFGVGPLLLLIVVLGVGAAALVSVLLNRAGSSDDPEVFAMAHGVALTPQNLERVREHQGATRRFRVVGALLGLVAGVAVSAGSDGPQVLLSTNWVFAAVAGYFVGALVGAWKSGVGAIGTARRASLVVRHRSEFLPEWVPWATYAAAAGSVAFLVASLAGGTAPRADGLALRVLVSAGAVTAAACSDLGTRRLAQAARPAVDVDAVAAFDVIARAACSVVAMAGLALCLWLLSCSAFAARPRAGQGLFWVVCVMVGTAAFCASAAVWFTSRRAAGRREPGLSL